MNVTAKLAALAAPALLAATMLGAPAQAHGVGLSHQAREVVLASPLGCAYGSLVLEQNRVFIGGHWSKWRDTGISAVLPPTC